MIFISIYSSKLFLYLINNMLPIPRAKCGRTSDAIELACGIYYISYQIIVLIEFTTLIDNLN